MKPLPERLKTRRRTSAIVVGRKLPRRLMIQTTVGVDSNFTLDQGCFDNPQFIDDRLAIVPAKDRGCLRSLFRYIYSNEGPRNMQKARYSPVRHHLEPAEKIVAQWLRTRTNGRHRKSYGHAALRCARAARFRCQVCGFPEVRTLHLDHVEGKIAGATFACLCANCHNIKSRKSDWSGRKRIAMETAAPNQPRD